MLVSVLRATTVFLQSLAQTVSSTFCLRQGPFLAKQSYWKEVYLQEGGGMRKLREISIKL
jgi:hypothetical protein